MDKAQSRMLSCALEHEQKRSNPDLLSSLCASLAHASLISSHAEFIEAFEIGAELGRGASSVVNEVTCKPGSSRPSWGGGSRAVKIMSKERLESDAQVRRMRDECRVLTELRHPGVIGLIEMFESPSEIYLLMERAAGGELFDRIVQSGSFTEPTAMQVQRQLLQVLAFMHRRGVIHRDIKPENILLASADSWEIKVSDFGLVKLLGGETPLSNSSVRASLSASASAERSSLPTSSCCASGKSDAVPGPFADARALTLCGSSFYMAPEVAWPYRRTAMTGEFGYGPGVDVWSAGVVLYILLSGNAPWHPSRVPHPDLPPEQAVVKYPVESLSMVPRPLCSRA